MRDCFGHWVVTYAEAALAPRYSGERARTPLRREPIPRPRRRPCPRPPGPARTDPHGHALRLGRPLGDVWCTRGPTAPDRAHGVRGDAPGASLLRARAQRARRHHRAPRERGRARSPARSSGERPWASWPTATSSAAARWWSSSVAPCGCPSARPCCRSRRAPRSTSRPSSDRSPGAGWATPCALRPEPGRHAARGDALHHRAGGPGLRAHHRARSRTMDHTVLSDLGRREAKRDRRGHRAARGRCRR